MRAHPIDHSNKLSHDERRLLKACEDFEALVLSYVLKAMRNTERIGEGLFGSSTVAQSYRDIFDFEVAKALSQRADIGIAKMLFESLVIALKGMSTETEDERG